MDSKLSPDFIMNDSLSIDSLSNSSSSNSSKCSLLENEFAGLDINDGDHEPQLSDPGVLGEFFSFQTNGQKKFVIKSERWEGKNPRRGTEIFIGKIPRDCMEDELIPLFRSCGTIYEFRLMMDYSGTNRGFAFCIYTSISAARNAVAQINGYEIRPNHKMGVCRSVDNCRLFVGGIPKRLKKQEIYDEISMVSDDVIDIIVYPTLLDKNKNRGFAFIEYKNHRAAAMARRKLLTNQIELWGQKVAVDWAEPEPEIDEEVMSKVKIIYVRNLMLSTTEEGLADVFSEFGIVERVKKIRDYAFVHLQTHEQAQACIEGFIGRDIEGAHVEISFAKPVDRESYQKQKHARQQAAAIVSQQQQNPQPPSSPQYTPVVGYVSTPIQDGFTFTPITPVPPQGYCGRDSPFQKPNKPKYTPSTGLSSIFKHIRPNRRSRLNHFLSPSPNSYAPTPQLSMYAQGSPIPQDYSSEQPMPSPDIQEMYEHQASLDPAVYYRAHCNQSPTKVSQPMASNMQKFAVHPAFGLHPSNQPMLIPRHNFPQAMTPNAGMGHIPSPAYYTYSSAQGTAIHPGYLPQEICHM
ncbi:hypothetical protein LOD99_13640 [Oopsacas minuta]|uniref:RRM domain-containing protein n=1 Tax=Oopsacas minuta TaxID=111878 RepID=A0AAV7KIG9_9METZ|nr:hypothetical protein LOD99_13640 [Oopsacas minuta]